MLPDDSAAVHPEIVAARSEIAHSVATSPLRIRLPTPPQQKGDSALFNEETDRAIEMFEKEYRRIWRPLLTPVALEVAYKPVLGSTQAVRDLDNLMRYVLSRFDQRFKPPSNVSKAWVSRSGGSRSDATDLPPKSIEHSIVRLDVFRIARLSGDISDGFFVMGLAPQETLSDDIWTKADGIIEKWRDG